MSKVVNDDSIGIFANALREVLGLGPLYLDGRDKRKETVKQRFSQTPSTVEGVMGFAQPKR